LENKMKPQGKVQLGKQGITDNFIETLRSHFKNYDSVRVNVLKGAGHDRNEIKEIADGITGKLGDNFTSKIIGFVIVVKKWRKARV